MNEWRSNRIENQVPSVMGCTLSMWKKFPRFEGCIAPAVKIMRENYFSKKDRIRSSRNSFYHCLLSRFLVTHLLWKLRFSKIHRISAPCLQSTKRHTHHPGPYYTCHTNRHTGTDTHTARLRTRGRHPGMHYDTSREWGGGQRAPWEDHGREICLQSNQHILQQLVIRILGSML